MCHVRLLPRFLRLTAPRIQGRKALMHCRVHRGSTRLVRQNGGTLLGGVQGLRARRHLGGFRCSSHLLGGAGYDELELLVVGRLRQSLMEQPEGFCCLTFVAQDLSKQDVGHWIVRAEAQGFPDLRFGLGSAGGGGIGIAQDQTE